VKERTAPFDARSWSRDPSENLKLKTSNSRLVCFAPLHTPYHD